jgi:hypothetical protein
MRVLHRACLAPLAHRHVSSVCRKGWKFELGDADAVEHRTNAVRVFGSGKEQSHQRTNSPVHEFFGFNQAIRAKGFIEASRVARGFPILHAGNWLGCFYKEERAWTYPAVR